TNQALAAGLRAFFDRLGVEKPIFIGASDGGMVAQIYAQKYPGAAGGLILISTGGMVAATLRSLRRKYFLAPLMLWYMKRCNDERLKPRLIRTQTEALGGDRCGCRYVGDQSPALEPYKNLKKI
ncbi:MAG: alpha/beta hydrolase, partial [Clostridiales bacterium]|nr:alpha/beta hydrolase [Clostridiales bacterium]